MNSISGRDLYHLCTNKGRIAVLICFHLNLAAEYRGPYLRYFSVMALFHINSFNVNKFFDSVMGKFPTVTAFFNPPKR